MIGLLKILRGNAPKTLEPRFLVTSVMTGANNGWIQYKTTGVGVEGDLGPITKEQRFFDSMRTLLSFHPKLKPRKEVA